MLEAHIAGQNVVAPFRIDSRAGPPSWAQSPLLTYLLKQSGSGAAWPQFSVCLAMRQATSFVKTQEMLRYVGEDSALTPRKTVGGVRRNSSSRGTTWLGRVPGSVLLVPMAGTHKTFEGTSSAPSTTLTLMSRRGNEATGHRLHDHDGTAKLPARCRFQRSTTCPWFWEMALLALLNPGLIV